MLAKWDLLIHEVMLPARPGGKLPSERRSVIVRMRPGERAVLDMLQALEGPEGEARGLYTKALKDCYRQAIERDDFPIRYRLYKPEGKPVGST